MDDAIVAKVFELICARGETPETPTAPRGGVTSQEMQTLLDLSKADVARATRRLFAAGKIEKRGRTRGTVYTLGNLVAERPVVLLNVVLGDIADLADVSDHPRA